MNRSNHLYTFFFYYLWILVKDNCITDKCTYKLVVSKMPIVETTWVVFLKYFLEKVFHDTDGAISFNKHMVGISHIMNIPKQSEFIFICRSTSVIYLYSTFCQKTFTCLCFCWIEITFIRYSVKVDNGWITWFSIKVHVSHYPPPHHMPNFS